MGTVPKGGAPVEQCPTCQGVFLDRSRLDRFLAAEVALYAGPAARVDIPGPRRAGGKRSFVAELLE
jgi:Zn-finger nucleic acid-binding protein